MSDKNRVKRCINEVLYFDLDRSIDDDATVESLGMDSLDEVELIMILEEEFDVEICDSEAENLKSIDDIVKLINSKFRY
jgi:acyl carrier protein